MIDGRIHLGEYGTGGEVGHQIVVPDGPLCGCGNHGCVEALARADTLAALAGQPDVATVYQRAADGDEACLAAINTVATYIGIGLANGWVVLGVPVVWIVIYLIAIRHEEAYLEEKFGTVYTEYKASVRRWC